jgi:4-aminobutyrate aminotransferase-like enzyme
MSVQRERTYYLQSYKAQPVAMAGGAGNYLLDEAGRKYLDFSAQFSAAALGHARPEMNAALRAELERGVGITSQFVTGVRAELAQRLCALLPEPLDACLFGCTGSDANEYALKIAKMVRGGGDIVGFHRAYHGATAGSAAATGKSETIQRHQGIRQLLPSGFIHASYAYCYRCDFGQTRPQCNLRCLEYLKRQILHRGPENVAGVIVEPIVAGGGVLVPPPGYLTELVRFCRAHGIVAIFDEVVTGFGRTGRLFAFEHEGAVPDVLVLGKALTGGYVPGSAVVVRREYKDLVDQFHLHGHTHSGYPLMCRAALTTLDLLERERLVEHAAAVGERLGRGLRGLRPRHPAVGDVRGLGLLWGLEIVQPDTGNPDLPGANRLGELLLEAGLVVEVEAQPELETSVIVLHPPLTLTEAEADAAVSMLDHALSRLEGSLDENGR